ncbi:glutathione binding-like protein [Rhizobium sp. LjRoot258]|uniref:glutathione binding-like protein n=1 Tax=Rhizobium sp. LjRoot258 TaxID=3342299 RepID=UPI003ECCE2BE
MNRYRREAERHYQVVNDHLTDRDFIVGESYTSADMSAWGWFDRASRVRKGADDPLGGFPNLKRLFETVDARPALPGRVMSARIRTSRKSMTKRPDRRSSLPTILQHNPSAWRSDRDRFRRIRAAKSLDLEEGQWWHTKCGGEVEIQDTSILQLENLTPSASCLLCRVVDQLCACK